jgi:hypothetical protein
MLSLNRPAIIAAGLGGFLWAAKGLVITLNDGSFDPLESFFFLGGLFCLLAACVLVSASLSRRLRPVARVAATIGGTFALIAATLAIEAVGVRVIGAIASGDNLGLEKEGGILLCGIAWMTLAAVGARSLERRPAARAVTA